MTPRELVVGLLALGSVAFVGLAAVGLVRLPDCYARAHAASKADTLGALAAFAAVGVAFDLGSATAKAVFLAVFVLATTPVATHAVVRTAYQSGLDPETVPESRERTTNSGGDES